MEGQDELRRYVEPLLAVRRQIMAEAVCLEKAILDFVKQDEACRLFMTAPGVGPLTALAFRSAIETPHRFRKSRQVGAHLGLTPRKYASGEVDYDGGITRCGDEMVRSHLFEAAKVLLSRVGKWSALKAWGMRLARRSGMKNACVAVARKLAVILHRMWVDGAELRYGSMPATVAA
jgi:transposase